MTPDYTFTTKATTALGRSIRNGYAATVAQLQAVERLHQLMVTCDNGSGYSSLHHAQQHLLNTLPEYGGCHGDRYWIARTIECGGFAK